MLHVCVFIAIYPYPLLTTLELTQKMCIETYV